MTPQSSELLAVLKQHFGYSSFRPLQEQIICDSLAGKDVFALLPTGGGKSLCFQLPALVRPGLTLVISPLISLMKDQVDALQASGIAATFLNSSLHPQEASNRVFELHNGKYRMLYIAPERAMLSGFLNDVKNWNVNLLAIDEAHCISEWGHDFRPEYRQLVELRKLLPSVPFMALTATATRRVREDIIKYLQLRSPSCYVASFNRPNLTYEVLPKTDAYIQLLTFLRPRKNESGIVYCQSRKTSEKLAEKLNADGIVAAPYHAGMEGADRTRHQELFLRDEVRVICATIAFGMGINKPNVRFVVHYDLPKNIEGYYQETGRAGRDGLPSECLLLFSGGDVVKQLHFIEEKHDEHERRIAKAQLEQMVHYAESAECRRSMLLEYFGEEYPDPSCDACDNCLRPREMYDGTISAQKFLSCVYRIREKSGFSVGLRHVVEVLTGGDTEKIRRWKHHELSTYGIGKEKSRDDWMFLGRELMRLRLLKKNEANGFAVVEVTPLGLETVKQRKPIMLTKPAALDDALRVAESSQQFDEALFEQLRSLRKRLADERNVPAYVIFSDVALRQMARQYPVTEGEFTCISGVGEVKLRDFGTAFITEIDNYLRTNARREFTTETAARPPQSKWMSETVRETLGLFRSGKSVDEIVAQRNLRPDTIRGHLLAAVNAGEEIDLNRLMTAVEQQEAAGAFAKLGFQNLAGVFEMLEERISYTTLRIYRSIMQKEQHVQQS